ncbi:MAG TPA: hypothetical protein VEH84_18595 [Alphaproteobacteria bacterium]|nr:hypothetical protein [Alphaproteobacteria bacterium]
MTMGEDERNPNPTDHNAAQRRDAGGVGMAAASAAAGRMALAARPGDRARLPQGGLRPAWLLLAVLVVAVVLALMALF